MLEKVVLARKPLSTRTHSTKETFSGGFVDMTLEMVYDIVSLSHSHLTFLAFERLEMVLKVLPAFCRSPAELGTNRS